MWDLQHGDRAKWIGVGIAAVSLLIAFLIFRRGSSSQQSAASVYPIAGTGQVNPQSNDQGMFGNLVAMISAQNAQTQAEIKALSQQQSSAPQSSAPQSPADTLWHQVLGMNSPTPTQDVTALEEGNLSWLVQNRKIPISEVTGGFLPPGTVFTQPAPAGRGGAGGLHWAGHVRAEHLPPDQVRALNPSLTL